MSDDYEDEGSAPPPRTKPYKAPRPPIDWSLWIMIVGTLGFLLIFAAITFSAPRRPFLSLRGLGPGRAAPKPAATAVGSPSPVVAGAPPAVPPKS